MIEFEILKKSKKSGARFGIIKTPHGQVLTPSLVPVATQAAVKTLTSKQVESTNTQILIANTFHLHTKTGEKIIKSVGGLHKFMNWKKPLMTDSGGFQVFSLGFGRDFEVGKILKVFPGKQRKKIITLESSPKNLKITDDGVFFRSPIDGKNIFLGPKESIKIQEALGADIIFAFDECTSPLTKREYIQKSLERTHEWAKICLDERKSKQALFGIVQGSKFKDFRIKSAKYIDSLGFDGYGIGGDLGKDKKDMLEILGWIIPHLNEAKPRHLLGIGYLEDMEDVIKQGIDLFDCTVPTHYARNGVAFTSRGKLNLTRSLFLKDKKTLDKKCGCETCKNYTKSYLSHLIKSKEITGMQLLTIHNLFFFNSYVESLREKIMRGKI